MPYENKPTLPEVEQAGVGEKVVLEGVNVDYVFDLAQGSGWTRQDFKVGRGGSEAKVKYWRPEKVLNVGQTVTVVGVIEEYQGSKSVSVDAKKGGGIASEGDPLHTVQPTQAPAPQAAQPKASGRKSFLVIYYEEVLKKFKRIYEEEKNACAATHSVMIAYNRGEISEEELSRWLAADDDVPF